MTHEFGAANSIRFVEIAPNHSRALHWLEKPSITVTFSETSADTPAAFFNTQQWEPSVAPHGRQPPIKKVLGMAAGIGGSERFSAQALCGIGRSAQRYRSVAKIQQLLFDGGE